MWSGLAASALGGILSTGGSLIGSHIQQGWNEDASDDAFARQLYLQEQAYKRQRELLKLQQDYASEMSSTAIQRQVADMRLAGINPILAASYGGASSPVVSAPSVSAGQASMGNTASVDLSGLGESIGKSGASALAFKTAKNLDKQVNSQLNLNDANASSARSAVEVNRTQARRNAVEAALGEAQIDKAKAEKKLIEAQTEQAGKRSVYEMPWELVRGIVRSINNNSAISVKLNDGIKLPETSNRSKYPLLNEINRSLRRQDFNPY